MISNKDHSTSNEPFQFKLRNIIARNSKKNIYIFQIISLCIMFCNFVKESTTNFIEFSRSSNLNEDISLTNADSFSKLISLVARFLFYMFFHFGARISFSALYKNRRVKVFFLSGNFRKMIDFMIFKTGTIYSIYISGSPITNNKINIFFLIICAYLIKIIPYFL